MTNYLDKHADLLPSTSLQNHQQAIADEAFDAASSGKDYRTIFYHNLGSGKSLSAIAAAENLKGSFGIVAPAALRTNFNKELDKFTDRKANPTVMSYSQLAKGTSFPPINTLIADEAHRLGTNFNSKQTQQLLSQAAKTKNLVLLSGSVLSNHPGELGPLLSAIHNEKITPEKFTDQFISSEKTNPGLIARLRGIQPGETQKVQNEDELRELLKGHVNYYSPQQELVPVKSEEHAVEMSEPQTAMYKAIFNKLPFHIRYKMQRDFPMNSVELQKLQSFLTGPRQVGLSTLPFLKDKDPYKAFTQSTKLNKAMELLKDKFQDPRAKALIFSNFVQAGLHPYSAALEKENIPHGIFSGSLNDKSRKQLVDDYNNNKLRAVLLGPSGAEGLSFKGTQLVQLLDPHWNSVRGKQQQGRGIRFDSHEDLPEDLRNVTVQRFISRLPLSSTNQFLTRLGLNREHHTHGTDDYLKLMAKKKDALNQQFLDILKDVGSKNPTEPTNKTYEAYNPNSAIPDRLSQNKKSILQKLYETVFGQTKQADNPVEIEAQPQVSPQKQKAYNLIERLKQIKSFSDKRDWDHKNQLLIQTMTNFPHQWEVAKDPKVPNHLVSIKHWPTGFQYHFPRALVPSNVYLDMKNRQVDPIVVNDELNKEAFKVIIM